MAACKAFADCSHANACTETCQFSRERAFAPHGGDAPTAEQLDAHARLFASCIEHAGRCTAIDVAMDYGPLGMCADEARYAIGEGSLLRGDPPEVAAMRDTLAQPSAVTTKHAVGGDATSGTCLAVTRGGALERLRMISSTCCASAEGFDLWLKDGELAWAEELVLPIGGQQLCDWPGAPTRVRARWQVARGSIVAEEVAFGARARDLDDLRARLHDARELATQER